MLFIFLISVFFSLTFLFFLKNVGPPQHRVPGTDYRVYYGPIADSILQGEGITREGKVIGGIPPGYPVILSGIFLFSHLTGINKLDSIVIFNVIVTASACIFLFLIAELIFNREIALIASFLWMSYPFNLWFIKNPNTEVPFILFLYLGIWLYILAIRGQNANRNPALLRKKYIGLTFLAGFILGLSSLVRHTSLFLPFLLTMLLIFFLKDSPKRVRFLLAVILLTGNLVAVIPWNIYLISKTGHSLQVSKFEVGGFRAGFTFALKPGEGGDQVIVSNDVRALMERIKEANLNSVISIVHFLTRELATKPLPLLKLIELKIVRAWYATSQMWWEGKILAVQIFYLLTAFIGIVLSVKIFKKKIREIIFLISIIFYFWAVISLFILTLFRYMVPVMGLVIIFSAVALDLVVNKLAKKFKFRSLCL